MEADSPTRRPNQSRLILIGGALLLLALVVGAVLLMGGSDDEGSTAAFAAPAECIESWNSDRQAVGLAQHNVVGHGYSAARAGYIDAGGNLSDDPASGECAVIFGATQLDIELEQAGQVNAGGVWRPLSASLEPATLETLQTTALELTNAAISQDGRLSPG